MKPTNPLTNAETYDFVGGPYDGRRMAVDPPAEQGVELVVHSVGALKPAEFYLLESDGKFHYETPSQAWPAALAEV